MASSRVRGASFTIGRRARGSPSPRVRKPCGPFPTACRITAMLVDSHCHLDFPELKADLEGVLARMSEAAVTHALTISTTLETFPAVREVVGARANLWCSAGVHPDERRDGREVSEDELVRMAQDAKVVAIGETGLDYYRVEGDT